MEIDERDNAILNMEASTAITDAAENAPMDTNQNTVSSLYDYKDYIWQYEVFDFCYRMMNSHRKLENNWKR